MIANHVPTRWLAVTVGIGVLLLLGAVWPGRPPGAKPADSALQAAFEENYQQFKAHCDKVKYSSDSSDRLESPYYRAIVAMGIPAVPYIVQAMAEDPKSPAWAWIGMARAEICRDGGPLEYKPWATPGQPQLQSWWQGGQRLENERFEWAYGQWKAAKAAGRAKDADKFFSTMFAIGIAALPPMMEKVSAGEAELLPSVQNLTGGAAVITGSTPQERTTACVAWWNQNKAKWLIPFPDQVALTEAAPATGSPAHSSGGATVAAPATGSPSDSSEAGTVAAPQEGIPSSHPAAAPVKVGRPGILAGRGGCGMRRS